MRFSRLFKTSASLLRILTVGALLADLMQAREQQTNEINKHVNLKGMITDTMCGAEHMMTWDHAKCLKRGSHYALPAGNQVYALVGDDRDFDRLVGDAVTPSDTREDEKIIRIALQPDTINNSSKSNSKQAPDDTAQSSEASIKGLVRDIACPIQNKAATARTFNLKCALECVRAGSPIVIQTDDGTLYIPISSSMPDQDQHRRLVPLIGKYAEIHGQVFERQGTRAIAIRQIRMLKRKLAPDAD